MPGFLKISLLQEVRVCVGVYACVHVSIPKLLVSGGMIWTPYDWLNKFYNFCMAAIVGIVSRRGLGIEAHRINQPNNTNLVM